jgi:hypothetical protein
MSRHSVRAAIQGRREALVAVHREQAQVAAGGRDIEDLQDFP